MNNEPSYDLAIVGGGLGGLALTIQAARAGYKTILFEKERYPFQRVCGEYISLESWNFLEDLGLPLSDMNLPHISRLLVSSPNGHSMENPLPLGGFGISRYVLDHHLAHIARRAGARIVEGTRIGNVLYEDDAFLLEAPGKNIRATMVAGSFGKRSNLDIKWHRPFASRRPNKLNNYIGVKYHIRIDHPPDLIALHNFSHGYCGISQVEEQKYCLCYLTTANNLKRCNNSIDIMEKEVLGKNPFLRKIFATAEFISPQPVVISQISFEEKSLVQDHVMMVGDAAGMITPLCGNGMSMALHGAKLAFMQIDRFMKNKSSRENMEIQYETEWKKHFAGRLRMGRFIQGFFGNSVLSDLLISTVKPFPRFTRWLIRQTHGEPF